MAGQVTAEEYKKVKNALNSTYTQDSLSAYKTAYRDAMNSGKSSKDAFASASGLLKKIDNWSSSWGSSWGSSNTNAWWDIYGDSSKNPTTKDPMDFSSYTGWGLDKSNAVFGDAAIERGKTEKGYLTTRNNQIAYDLYNNKKWEQGDVENYLNEFDSFVNARDEDKANTVRAITDRLQAIKEEEENKKNLGEDLNLQNLGDKEPGTEWKAWYYNTKDGLQKIYGYDEMDEETKNLVDRLDDSKKKYVSNLWAKWMQEDLKYYLDTMRAKDQAGARQDINQQLYDINRESSLIQAEQTIRNAEESYNNLKQNWQYLGNLGMPWVSATKIQAIGDAITEAKTTLWEVKRLTQLSLDAQEKQWEGQVLQYNQQIDNLMYDLKWKVWDEITGALSKYTTAELEGKLDTIDGITAFRKELLDDLDNNLSGLTSASLTQMQWINQQYQDVATKMYEYAQNANKVNTEMSTVKGYYVDGNGNPIYNAKGEVIEVPQSAPMDPVFDKETGKLITFSLDENGNITANVQQLWDSWVETAQSRIINALNYGYSVSDILKAYPDLDPKTVQDLAKIIKPSYNQYGLPTTWEGRNYTAVDVDTMDKVLNNFKNKYKKGDKGGQCGAFVNNYLRELWVIPKDYSLFIDPITEKTKNINSDTPQIGGIVIMNSESKPQYWHVWIITNIDENGNMTILQSNKEWEEEVFISTKNINDGNILGYFDPTKSIEEYNNWASQGVKGEEKKWYSPEKAPLYESYLNGDYTNIGDLIKDEEFQQEAYVYGRKQGSATALDALSIMAKMNAITRGESKGLFGKIWDIYDWNKLYNQLEKTLTLNQLTELKKRSGASLWAMSEWEWKILGDAATNLSKIGTATWMQTKAWEDEMRALTLAAYPDEANRNNWHQVVMNHWDELAGVYGGDWGMVEESSVEIWYDPLQNK